MKNNLLIIFTLLFSVHSLKSLDHGREKRIMEKVKKESKPTPNVDYIIRKGKLSDRDALLALYKKVAAIPGGLARTSDEITGEYIDKIIEGAINKGLMFVAEYKDTLIGSIVIFKLEPKVFSHVLSDGTILIDPDFQGIGIGSKIFSALLNEVKDNHPEILRVEIFARESNPAIKLYERLGFKKQGRFEDRIKGVTGKLEADIPMAWFNPNYKQDENKLTSKL